MLTGINHITLATDNLDRSVEFYQLLGFTVNAIWNQGAYLSLNGLWLCLSLGEVDVRSDYSHLALGIEEADFEAFSALLDTHNVPLWKENSSEGQSIYFLDPNGHKLEAHCGTLESRLKSIRNAPYDGLRFIETSTGY